MDDPSIRGQNFQKLKCISFKVGSKFFYFLIPKLTILNFIRFINFKLKVRLILKTLLGTILRLGVRITSRFRVFKKTLKLQYFLNGIS